MKSSLYFSRNEKTIFTASVVMRSLEPVQDILTFGIYGRDFNLDDHPDDKGAAEIQLLSSVLIAVLTVHQFFRIFH